MITEHRLIWQDHVIDIRHVSNWHSCNIDHLEIRTASPERAAIPITETGYRSHFVCESNIIEAGGAAAYVRTWLDQDAQSPEWKTQAIAARQGSLF